MTPEEKAIELFSKYMSDLVNELGFNDDTFKLNKDFALIAVDELIYSHSQDTTDNQFYYWKEVKTEIEKL
jgi:hypothetical protein